jgi:hypothetical protein
MWKSCIRKIVNFETSIQTKEFTLKLKANDIMISSHINLFFYSSKCENILPSCIEINETYIWNDNDMQLKLTEERLTANSEAILKKKEIGSEGPTWEEPKNELGSASYLATSETWKTCFSFKIYFMHMHAKLRLQMKII